MLILALEASTSSAKAMLYNTEDGTSEVITRPYLTTGKDASVQDAEEVYKQITSVGRQLAEGKNVSVICIGSTWHSVMLCDKKMKPVTGIYLWSNTEASGLCKELRKDRAYTDSFYKKTGCMVSAIYPFFKLKYLKGKGYDLADYQIMGQGTYCMFRLTGKRVTTPCMASGSGLMNILTCKYEKDLLCEIGINEDQLCPIVPSETAFALSSDAAECLGLKAGIPVLPANSDGGLNQIGSGAAGKGIMTFSVGTSGAIRLSTEKPVLTDNHSTWCYRSPASWLSGAATNGCCNCIEWFKQRICSEGTDYASLEKSVSDFDNPPVFLPFLFGERCPGWEDEKTGGFKRLLPYHTRNDMYLAIQQGILFNLYQCYDKLVRANGVPTRVKLSGGIVHSEKWLQMCADIFKTDMEIDNTEHGSLMGSVVLAMKSAGIIDQYDSYESHPVRIIKFDDSKSEYYSNRFDEYLEEYNKE